MVASTYEPIDDSPLVQPRAPRITVEDRDSDGTPDVFLYDFNGDGAADVEHRIIDRKTFVTVQRSMPWQPSPTFTHYTGADGEIPLRVTFRVRRVAELMFEINGIPVPACLESHGMESIGCIWTFDRERDNEVEAARHFWCMNGGVGGFERL